MHVLYFVLKTCSSSAFSVLNTSFFSNSDSTRVSQTILLSKTRAWAVSVILGTHFFSNSDAARVSRTIFFSKTRAWAVSNMKASQNKQPAGLSTRFYVSDPRAIVKYFKRLPIQQTPKFHPEHHLHCPLRQFQFKIEVTHCISICDILHHPAQPLFIPRVLAILHPASDEVAEDSAEILMSCVG